jgi:hypothetical protein
MAPSSAPEHVSLADIDAFIDEHRSRCLWFFRPDYRPGTAEERLDALERIARCGDREAFQRAAAFKRWLSQTSSAASADS